MNNNDIKNFAANLRTLMEHHSLSHRVLAKAIGISRSYVFKLTKETRSNPSFNVVESVAKVFQVSLFDLFEENKIDFNEKSKKLNLKPNVKQ